MDSIGHGRPSAPVGFRWPEESVVLEALTATIRPEQIEAALAGLARKKQRIRRLPAVAVAWLVICLGVWSQDNIPTIWRRLGGTFRALFAALDRKRPPVKSAFSQARQRLGAAVMRRLFRQASRSLFAIFASCVFTVISCAQPPKGFSRWNSAWK